MRKRLILFLLFTIFIQKSYPEESAWLAEISYRIAIPDSMFINFVIGRHFPIIPHIISPGISVDGGLGRDWFVSSDEKRDKTTNKNYEQFGVNLGFRIYNLIEIGIVDINTFIGYNSILGHQDELLPEITHNPIIGASIAVKFIGLEYSYYIPTDFSNNIALHHAALVFHFKK